MSVWKSPIKVLMNGKYKLLLIGWSRRLNGGAISLHTIKILMMIIHHMFWKISMMRESRVRGIISIIITPARKVNKIIIILCSHKTNI